MEYISILALILSIVLPLASFFYTVYRDRVKDARDLLEDQRNRERDKRMLKVEEEQKREREAAELIRSRAESPFFVVFDASGCDLIDRDELGIERNFNTMSGYILCDDVQRIPERYPKGDPVFLPIENRGKSARNLRITSAGEEIKLRRNRRIEPEFTYLLYDYDPDRYGEPMDFVFSFETEDGRQGAHTYRTRHAQWTIERVDPP